MAVGVPVGTPTGPAGERVPARGDHAGRRDRLGQLGRHQHDRAQAAVDGLGDVHPEAVSAHVGAHHREAGLRDLAEVREADRTPAGRDLAGLVEALVVEADAAVVDLDDRAALDLPQRDQHLRGGRGRLGGVREQLGDHVDQRLHHAGRHGDRGVAGHLDALVGGDAAGGATHHVGQRQRIVPLLARPLAAQRGEGLGVACLLGGRVVDPHAGVEDVRVGRVLLHHPRRLLLDAVRGGLDLAAERDDGRGDRVLPGQLVVADPGELDRGLVEQAGGHVVVGQVGQRGRRDALHDRRQLLFDEALERDVPGLGQRGEVVVLVVEAVQLLVVLAARPRRARGARGDHADRDRAGGEPHHHPQR